MATVVEAIQVMLDARVGAVVVMSGGRVAGMFSERDVAVRVVLGDLDPHATLVKEVMTTNVFTVGPETDIEDALELMDAMHFRHLPVVDPTGRLVTVLSMRHLLREDIDVLSNSVNSPLQSYLSADGMGG